MPALNWIGKEAVVRHHKEVPFRVLQLAMDDAVDAAANARHKEKINDPEWRAQFWRLRPDLCESDLPPLSS